MACKHRYNNCNRYKHPNTCHFKAKEVKKIPKVTSHHRGVTSVKEVLHNNRSTTPSTKLPSAAILKTTVTAKWETNATLHTVTQNLKNPSPVVQEVCPTHLKDTKAHVEAQEEEVVCHVVDTTQAINNAVVSQWVSTILNNSSKAQILVETHLTQDNPTVSSRISSNNPTTHNLTVAKAEAEAIWVKEVACSSAVAVEVDITTHVELVDNQEVVDTSKMAWVKVWVTKEWVVATNTMDQACHKVRTILMAAKETDPKVAKVGTSNLSHHIHVEITKLNYASTFSKVTALTWLNAPLLMVLKN